MESPSSLQQPCLAQPMPLVFAATLGHFGRFLFSTSCFLVMVMAVVAVGRAS